MIASPETPLRCSSTAALQGCPGLWALRAFGRDSAGQAAHNGSAVSRVIELWHQHPDLAAALARTATEAPERWALWEPDVVRAWAEGYCADPRNGAAAGEVRCEVEVSVALAPAEDDPTGQPVCLRGRLDQVRRRPGEPWRVWDLKSGRPGGQELVYAHAWQVGAYALAHEATTGQPTLPGGVIRLRGYDVRPKAAHELHATHFPASGADAGSLLALASEISAHVARLRRGEVLLQPGSHCAYCPAGNPWTCHREVAALTQLTL